MLFTPPIYEKENLKSPQSLYLPDERVRGRYAELMKDYQISETIMTQPYEEFGYDESGEGYNLVGRLNYNQKKFNLYRAPKSKDPDLSWHSNALKPVIRNKVISLVAHITSQVLFPDIIAQNDDANEDKDMAAVMKDAVIWACEQSKYEDMFINAIQEMCVNPAIILFQDFAKVKKSIKLKKKGKTELKEVIDEIYSGFISSIVSLDELYISNIYEPEIQKQPWIIRRKIIDFATATRKYKKNENFKYVKPGVTTFFDEEHNLFYEASDDELEGRLVSEVTYYNRGSDLEIVILGGIMMSDPDDGMRRDDKLYPFACSVYETYNSRFFYGMALVQKLEPDEDNLTRLWQMYFDGTYQTLRPAVSVYGEANVSAGDFAPGSINVYADPNVKVEPMNLQQNLAAGANAIQFTEQSMAESSKQDYTPKSDTTAREIAYMEEQTKLSLGRTGKMVAKLVKDFGQLLVGSIVQNLPIAVLGDIVGDTTALKFPTLFLADQENEEGKQVTKKIEFTNDLPEAETQEELDKIQEEESYKLLGTEEKLGMSIAKVRPEAFRNMKYKVKVVASFLSQSTKFAKKMMMFDRLVGNPNVKQKELIKSTILKELEPGHEEEYLQDAEPVVEEASNLPQPTLLNNQELTL